jgi:TAG lipase/lysophosphatidylethanolamine acyltransferase
LFEQGLLPRIISGASVGSLIAALVCTRVDDEIPILFQDGGVSLDAFESRDAKGSLSRKFKRLLERGVLMDVRVLEDVVRSNIGDVTFAEAFARTGRVLNVSERAMMRAVCAGSQRFRA